MANNVLLQQCEDILERCTDELAKLYLVTMNKEIRAKILNAIQCVRCGIASNTEVPPTYNSN